MQPSKRPFLRALVPGALLLVAGSSCKQPTMNCTTAHLYYAAKYELTKGDPDSPCAQQKGDILGMQTYFATGGINGTAKFDEPTAAIRPQYAGLLIVEAQEYPVEVPGFTGEKGVEHWPNAVGDFEGGFPDGEDLCHVPELVSEFTRPELPAIADDPMTPDVDETAEATPPVSVSYEWSDARWLNTPTPRARNSRPTSSSPRTAAPPSSTWSPSRPPSSASPTTTAPSPATASTRTSRSSATTASTTR
ncbi:hypothetical protein [Nannocystis pusilla]|uniref:hypothetical protein n=1 Tax=Nannocystis pusilla TaxID=889268 RepID=UPI003B76CC51